MRISDIFRLDPPPSDAECASTMVGANAKLACKWVQDPNHWYNDIPISDQEIHRQTGE